MAYILRALKNPPKAMPLEGFQRKRGCYLFFAAFLRAGFLPALAFLTTLLTAAFFGLAFLALAGLALAGFALTSFSLAGFAFAFLEAAPFAALAAFATLELNLDITIYCPPCE